MAEPDYMAFSLSAKSRVLRSMTKFVESMQACQHKVGHGAWSDVENQVQLGALVCGVGYTPAGAILKPGKTSFLVSAKTSTVHLGSLGHDEAGIPA